MDQSQHSSFHHASQHSDVGILKKKKKAPPLSCHFPFPFLSVKRVFTVHYSHRIMTAPAEFGLNVSFGSGRYFGLAPASTSFSGCSADPLGKDKLFSPCMTKQSGCFSHSPNCITSLSFYVTLQNTVSESFQKF